MVATIFQLLSPIIAIAWIVHFAIHWRGIRSVPRLPIANEPLSEEPLVSVVIAAKNEEEAIAETIESIARQRYRNLELIVVNDRSSDRTGIIAEQKASALSFPARVIHIRALPAGWLGKNRALQTGFERANGSFVLFTDADVRFHPDTIRSAARYMIEREVDHLALAPKMEADGFWLRAFVHYFMFSLSMVKWPWLPNNDHQKKHGYGIGAFNLLRREAYLRIGKHETIAMRPDDDLQLGAKVKEAGLRQRFLIAYPLLRVQWYPSLKAAMIGLEKNMFAGLGYSIPLLIAAVIGKFVFYFAPFLALLFATGIARLVYVFVCFLILLLYVRYTRRMSGEFPAEWFVFPALVLLFLYVTVRSCALFLIRGGMRWRGTFYALKDLRTDNNRKR